MAKKSLSNFCVFVLKNGQFRRFKFPFEKSIQRRLFLDEVGCCLSYFWAQIDLKGILSWVIGFGVDAGWAILVHEPGRLTNRSPGNPALVGGQLINTQPGRRYDTPFIPQG